MNTLTEHITYTILIFSAEGRSWFFLQVWQSKTGQVLGFFFCLKTVVFSNIFMFFSKLCWDNILHFVNKKIPLHLCLIFTFFVRLEDAFLLETASLCAQCACGLISAPPSCTTLREESSDWRDVHLSVIVRSWRWQWQESQQPRNLFNTEVQEKKRIKIK